MTIYKRLGPAACLALTIAATAAAQDRMPTLQQRHTAPAKTYTPASVQAQPGLTCQLYAAGSAPSARLTVFTDGDGYARFYAVRATAGEAVRQLNLDCTDGEGHVSLYTVDLTSDETFAPRPLNLANELGGDRPALKGDPMSYTQAELIQRGYGLRPDPAKDPAAFAQWLDAASLLARMLAGKPSIHKKSSNRTGGTPVSAAFAVPAEASLPASVTKAPSNFWLGAVMNGEPNYLNIQANFNVPELTPGGDETKATEASIWDGLGGYGVNGLIQSGIFAFTTPSAATLQSFREYCCGDGPSNNYRGNFNPAAGDELFVQNWYCDASGNLKLKGGFGCSFVHDKTSGATLSCTTSTGSPCPSVPALPLCSVNPNLANCFTLGASAEFILEDDSPQDRPPSFNPIAFNGTITMAGSAYSSQTKAYTETVSTDPNVILLVDETGGTSHVAASIGTNNQTYFAGTQFLLVSGKAQSGLVHCTSGECNPESIAVGPTPGGGILEGRPWVLGTAANSAGDYPIFQWQWTQASGGTWSGSWVQKPGYAQQIAISPQGVPWAIDHSGKIYYWNGSAFAVAPGNGCAHWIGVGPAIAGLPNGSPWVIGCDSAQGENGSVYQLQGSSWVRQSGAAVQIAVSPQGIPWAINAAGNVFYGVNLLGFLDWVQVPGCAVGIAAGPNTAPFAFSLGDAWALGCGTPTGGGYNIFQYQQNSSGNVSWVQIPGRATQISVSPDLGVPWLVTSQGQIYQ